MEEFMDDRIGKIPHSFGIEISRDDRFIILFVIRELTGVHRETINKLIITVLFFCKSAAARIANCVVPLFVSNNNGEILSKLIVVRRVPEGREFLDQKIDRLGVQNIDNEIRKEFQIRLGKRFFGVAVAVHIDKVGVALFLLLLFLFRLLFLFYLFFSLFFRLVVLKRRDLVIGNDLAPRSIGRILDRALLSIKILEFRRENKSDPRLILVDGDDLLFAEQLQQIL